MSQALVSVIIPTYKRTHYLEETLNSRKLALIEKLRNV